MNFDDYQTAAARTINTALSARDQLANSAMGLMGEIAEVTAAIKNQSGFVAGDTLRKEMGDVTWYVALACTCIGAKMSELVPQKNEYDYALYNLIGYAGQYAEIVKKVTYQGHIFDGPKHSAALHALGGVIGSMEQIADDFGIGLPELMAENIAKLAARFPDRFSADRSINRDE